MPHAHEFVQTLDGFIFGLQPEVPLPARVLIERSLGEIAAQAVVNLPRDELGMLAEGLGHVLHDAFGVVPKYITGQTDRAARAFTSDQAPLIHGQNLRMFLRQPNGRRGGGRGQNDLDAGLAH